MRSLPRSVSLWLILYTAAPCPGQTTDPQTPTDWDLLALKLTNTARTDPAGENARRGTTYSNPPVPPLAYDLLIGRAAENHVQWMSSNATNPAIDNPLNGSAAPDSFSHYETLNAQQNGIPATTTPWYTGAGASDRISHTGFSWSSWGENIFWGFFPATINAAKIESNHVSYWKSVSHRDILMRSSYTTFGHHAMNDSSFWGGQEFASPSGSPRTHLLGVLYEDKNDSGAWEPHSAMDPMREGLASIPYRVYVNGTLNQVGEDALTFDNGGFSFRVGNGIFDVQFLLENSDVWIRDVLVMNANIDVGDVEAIDALAGDFNRDGLVDAADFTVWRDGLGTNYAPVDYRVWKLNFGGGPTVAGDFNRNGVVDAADYTVWRDNLGTVYMPNDYDKWKMNFGNSSAGGSAAAQIAVPEPATWLLLIGLVAHNRAARRGKVRRAP